MRAALLRVEGVYKGEKLPVQVCKCTSWILRVGKDRSNGIYVQKCPRQFEGDLVFLILFSIKGVVIVRSDTIEMSMTFAIVSNYSPSRLFIIHSMMSVILYVR